MSIGILFAITLTGVLSAAAGIIAGVLLNEISDILSIIGAALATGTTAGFGAYLITTHLLA